MELIKKDAANMDPRAVFILDQIKNYKKSKPIWSEMTIRQCIAWRFCSPKAYEFPRNMLLKLPCNTTLRKYFGSGNQNLIKNRLMSEIQNLNISERVCSLVVDDMAIRESMRYSKAEDRIFGLETIPKTDDTIGSKPLIANQLLCFVVHGLSTKYIVPASYYFHRQLNSKDLYKLTLEVMKLLDECGFKVIRIVGDNHKNHVALFKHFGNGTLQNVIAHPFSPGLKLFLSFDYCHATKNGRNLYLDHDMASSDGIISSQYLKDLSEMQGDLIIKPVRRLTRKHLFPTNLEKMKVKLAVQIFSPPVTASLRYLAHHASEEFSHFKECMATVKYLENMYKFFQLHDVSNRSQHFRQRDLNTAPYTDTYDARLLWLEQEFPGYIEDIQTTSKSMGMKGLTKETAEAFIFTAKSTSLCIKYLITDLNFYYVLTRSFSSDAIESLFANIRLRNGCNDLTDCRAAEHAIRQILKNGLIGAVNYSNSLSTVEYTSNAQLVEMQSTSEINSEISITLDNTLIRKLENLQAFVSDVPSVSHIESAATAFLCGYIIMKVEESVQCELCLCSLRNSSPEKTSPLLELIYNQDRGKLNYPSQRFVALVENVVELIVEILPSLPKENVDCVLKTIFSSYLINNPIFRCESHYKIVCSTILNKLVPPILTNFCGLHSQSIKKKYVNAKKRKLLKLNPC
jgi:hypothetical protein